MASTNKTEHCGLNLWEGTDHFLRADFNADNERIDAAIHAAKSAAERAAADLVPVSYHVYNLMLQNYYEGKETGYKRALLFDGFLEPPEGALSAGLFHSAADKALCLDAVGQTGFSQDYGDSGRCALGNYTSYTEAAFTTTGRCRLTGITFRCRGSGMAVTLYKGGSGTVVQEVEDHTQLSELTDLTVPFSCTLEAETNYVIRCSRLPDKTQTLMSSRGDNENFRLGFKLVCTPVRSTSGSLTLPARDLGGDYGRATAWVRHSAGTPALSVKDAGGGWRVFTRTASTPAVNLQGAPCTESAFLLDEAPPAPNRDCTVKLDFSCPSGLTANPRLYDYGVVFL